MFALFSRFAQRNSARTRRTFRPGAMKWGTDACLEPRSLAVPTFYLVSGPSTMFSEAISQVNTYNNDPFDIYFGLPNGFLTDDEPQYSTPQDETWAPNTSSQIENDDPWGNTFQEEGIIINSVGGPIDDPNSTGNVVIDVSMINEDNAYAYPTSTVFTDQSQQSRATSGLTPTGVAALTYQVGDTNPNAAILPDAQVHFSFTAEYTEMGANLSTLSGLNFFFNATPFAVNWTGTTFALGDFTGDPAAISVITNSDTDHYISFDATMTIPQGTPINIAYDATLGTGIIIPGAGLEIGSIVIEHSATFTMTFGMVVQND